MNTKQLETLLQQIIEEFTTEENDCEMFTVKTFEESNILTTDNGLIVKTNNNEKFLLTIQKIAN